MSNLVNFVTLEYVVTCACHNFVQEINIQMTLSFRLIKSSNNMT